ncbi:MAG: hypothetical protein HZC17_01765 [Candidatus Omnitrophica bacterium]|nr:hypothetical protein [Candidatus Omnitrophota bacterium]
MFILTGRMMGSIILIQEFLDTIKKAFFNKRRVFAFEQLILVSEFSDVERIPENIHQVGLVVSAAAFFKTFFVCPFFQTIVFLIQ